MARRDWHGSVHIGRYLVKMLPRACLRVHNGILQLLSQPRTPQMRGMARKRPSRALPSKSTEKRLDCVILGRPNAGKSVLLNSLIETKLAATNRKRHTTRGEILGVYNRRDTQLAFYDTPGYVFGQDAQSHEMKALRSISIETARKADVIILCVDAALHYLNDKQQSTFVEMVKVALHNAKTEMVLVLNKVDLVRPKTKLLETTRQLVSLINGVKYSEEGKDEAELDTTTFMVSALHHDGIADVREYLLGIASNKPWVLPRAPRPLLPSSSSVSEDEEEKEGEDSAENSIGTGGRHQSRKITSIPSSRKNVTNLTLKERVNEIVLENLLSETHEEIPYIADIRTKSIRSLTEKRIRIDVNIFVDTGAQQRIVVGHQARTLLAIRQKSVRTLEKIFGQEVILMLWVKTRMKKSGKVDKNQEYGIDEDDDLDGDDDEDEVVLRLGQ